MRHLLFLIIASRDIVHEQDMASQKATFATNGEFNKFFFLRGSVQKMVQKNEQDLYVNCHDSYQNILQKTILGFQEILRKEQFDFLIRSNVSTYFDLISFQKKLINIEPSKDPLVLGFREIAKNSEGLEEVFISGNSFILNKAAVELLAEVNWEKYRSIPDDIALSREIVRYGIRTISLRRGNLHKSKIFIPSTYVRAKSSERAELTSHRILSLHKYYTAKGQRKILEWFKISLYEFRETNWTFQEIGHYLRDLYVLVRLYFLNANHYDF